MREVGLDDGDIVKEDHKMWRATPRTPRHKARKLGCNLICQDLKNRSINALRLSDGNASDKYVAKLHLRISTS